MRQTWCFNRNTNETDRFACPSILYPIAALIAPTGLAEATYLMVSIRQLRQLLREEGTKKTTQMLGIFVLMPSAITGRREVTAGCGRLPPRTVGTTGRYPDCDVVRPSASLANDYWISIDAAGQTYDFRVDPSGRLRSSVRPIGRRRAIFLLARSNGKHYENVMVKALDPSQEGGRT